MTPRIYHPEALATGQTVTLSDSAAAHVGRVLRLGAGDDVRLFNGDGQDYPGRIAKSARNRIEVVIHACETVATESPLDITLLQGICRNPRMDLLMQKATELGVRRLVPVQCRRSVTRLDAARAEKRLAHWTQVAISACEQSGRARLPAIEAPCPLDAALDRHVPQSAGRILLDPAGDCSLQAAMTPGSPVALLIGPEGGLNGDERATAIAAGFRRVRLGPRILRTETAPLAALSIIQFLSGDLDAPDKGNAG